MNYSNEIYQWVMTFIFFLGILILPIGIAFCIFPNKVFDIAKKMNKWIVTDGFFQIINKPRYKEPFFYRHHRLFGMGIVIVSMTTLYILTLYLGHDSVLNILNKLAGSAFEKWLYIILYYQLLGFISLTIIFGMIMFVRPSSLKYFEKWSNDWIDTDKPLKVLDSINNIPDKILPGNPRVFGLFVIMGAMYMIWCTYP